MPIYSGTLTEIENNINLSSSINNELRISETDWSTEKSNKVLELCNKYDIIHCSIRVASYSLFKVNDIKCLLSLNSLSIMVSSPFDERLIFNIYMTRSSLDFCGDGYIFENVFRDSKKLFTSLSIQCLCRWKHSTIDLICDIIDKENLQSFKIFDFAQEHVIKLLDHVPSTIIQLGVSNISSGYVYSYISNKFKNLEYLTIPFGPDIIDIFSRFNLLLLGIRCNLHYGVLKHKDICTLVNYIKRNQKLIHFNIFTDLVDPDFYKMIESVVIGHTSLKYVRSHVITHEPWNERISIILSKNPGMNIIRIIANGIYTNRKHLNGPYAMLPMDLLHNVQHTLGYQLNID